MKDNINLNKYFYHSIKDSFIIDPIMKKGILSRKNQSKIGKENFTHRKDFIKAKYSNYISVSKYKTLSFFMFNLPFVTLIIKNNYQLITKDDLIEGEYLILDKIMVEDIIGVGINEEYLKSNKSYKHLNDYKKTINNLLKYNLPFYNLLSGEKITINKNLKNNNKGIKLLLLSTKYSGKKDVVYMLEKKYNFKIDNYNENDNVIYFKEVKDEEYDLIIHLETLVNKYRRYYIKVPNEINNYYKEEQKIYKKWNNYSNYYIIKTQSSIKEKLKEVEKIINFYL